MVPLLYRRRDAAQALGFSERQILHFETQGLLTPIRVPGVRAVRYTADDVQALAKRFVAASAANDNARRDTRAGV